MTRFPLLLLGSALVLQLLPASASGADEKNPDVIACEGKKEGDACESTKLVKEGESAERKVVRGVCRPDECCDLDYSQGSPPKTDCGPCLACKAGPPEPTPDEAKEPQGDGAEGAELPRVEAGQEPPAQSPSEKRGCTVGDKSVPAWAGLVLLLAFSRRRQ